MEPIVKWPFGEAGLIALSATGDQAIAVDNELTFIDGVSVPATGNRTLNVTVDESIGAGALLMVQSKTAATQTTIFGTGITGATITGVIGKTFTVLFVYDGSGFVQMGDSAQID